MKCIKCDMDIPDNSLYCNYCGRKQAREYSKGKKQRGNGTGSVFKLSNGKYRAVITLGYSEDGHRKQRTKSGFKSKKEALEYLPKLKEAPETNKIKFNKLYEMWRDTHFLTKVSQSSSHIIPHTRDVLIYTSRTLMKSN